MPLAKKLAYFAILHALLCLCLAVGATTYYVDGPNPAASDSNPGTEALPLKTIQKGVDLAVAGDRVFVKAGDYNENLAMKHSGSEGNQITIEAQRGPNGERLVTIHGGIAVNTWQPAPEIGEGVYKANIGFRPYAISLDGKYLDKVAESQVLPTHPRPNMGDESWKSYFTSNIDFEATADNPEHNSSGSSRKLKFWDVTYGIFGTKYGGSTTYLRLKDRSNPNSYSIRASDASHSIIIANTSNIVFRGFKVQDFYDAFTVAGQDSYNIIIEDNLVMAHAHGVHVKSGAHDVAIRNNEFTWVHHGFSKPGAWGGTQYEDYLQEALYQWPHHWIFNGVVAVGVNLADAGGNIDISGNFIHSALLGVYELNSNGVKTSRVKISGNRIFDHSSVGIVVEPGFDRFEISDNTLYNNNINIRFMVLENPGYGKTYIYKNLLGNPEGEGSGFWLHWTSGLPKPANPPEAYIYHNSFRGGRSGIGTNGFGYQYELVPGFYILDNLISSPGAFSPSDNNIGHHFVGSFNYNWVGNLVKGLEWKYGVGKVPPWFGPNNIQSPSNFFWLPPGGSDFGISADSNVVDRGLDLSRAQDINGKTIGPLPGIASDYYCGSAPDIGAVQYCPVVAGCGDGVCVAGETPASCAADCNSGAVNCGTKGKFCAQNEYCSSGVCIKNGCPAPPIDFAKLKTYEGSWLNRIISMAEFMAKILEWKKCGA